MNRILIIDNEECIRAPLAIFSEMLDYEPTVASDPTACDVFAPSSCFCTMDAPCTDILLVDQNVAGMKGLDLIQRQQDHCCKLSTQYKAVMSSCFSTEELNQAEKLGCRIFQKPLRFATLQKWLNEIARH